MRIQGSPVSDREIPYSKIFHTEIYELIQSIRSSKHIPEEDKALYLEKLDGWLKCKKVNDQKRWECQSFTAITEDKKTKKKIITEVVEIPF
jgi:hypothetical protein